MTVHGIRIKTSKNQESNPSSVPKPAPPDLHNVVHDRVKQHIKYNFNPVLEEQDSPAGLVKAGEMTSYSVDHARGSYRFSGSDDLTGLLDSIESKVGADAKWYKVESHVCDHDELDNPDRKGCGHYDSNGDWQSGWKTERTKGNVPEGI